MIIDTDILIDYFKGVEKAQKTIKKINEPAISVITLFELCQGARNKKEWNIIRSFLREWAFKIIQLDEKQSLQTLSFMERYNLSHGLKMADAMIASCAFCNCEELITGNYIDYQFIAEIVIHKYKK
ncbi:MAG: type II toxin-antitoxin system VapC family toxin [bacterium]